MLDFSIVIFSLVVVLWWGLKKSGNIKTFKDFAIPNSSLSTPLIVATMFATVVGSASTIGFAEKVFLHGIQYLIPKIGGIVGYLIIAFVIAPRFKQFEGKLSLGDIIYTHYGQSGKFITGIFGALYSTGILAAQISAIGYLFFYLFGISHSIGISIGALVIILYSYIGGIKAVTFTDALQFGIIILAIPIIGSVAVGYVGGVKNIWHAIPDSHRTLFPDNIKTIEMISLGFLFAIPRLSPAIVQRLFMAKDGAQIRATVWYVEMLMIPFIIIIMLIGLTALHLNPTINPNNALFYVVETVIPIGFKGFAIAGILAIIMSTADSDLNAGCISLTHDVISPLAKKFNFKINDLNVARWTTLLLGTIAIFVAVSFQSIFDLMVSFLSLWVPVMMVPLLGTIFGIRVSKKMFFTLILVGLISYYVSKAFFLAQTGINASLVGFIINSFLFMAFRIKSTEAATNNTHCTCSFCAFDCWLAKVFNVKTLLNFKTNLINNLHIFSNIKVKDSSIQHVAFGSFCIINCIVPLYIWPYGETQHTHLIQGLFFFAMLTSFILVMKDSFGDSLKKFLPIYWYLTLLFCLPFLTTFTFLLTGVTPLSIANLILGVFMLSLLVSSNILLSLVFIGVTLAFSIYIPIFGTAHFNPNYIEYIWPIFLYMLSILFGIIFSRNRELLVKNEMNHLKMIGGAIAHELRTPMAIINNGITALEASAENELPPAKKSFFINTMKRAVKNSHHSMDMFLSNINDDKAIIKEPINLQALVRNLVEEYPFSSGEKELVTLHLTETSPIHGDFQMIQNVIWNLLKNALYQIRAHDRGEITITSESDGKYEVIKIKDTAQGIPQEEMKKMFNLFHTKSKGGTGVGLAFCKNIMERHGGRIKLNSEFGHYAEFSLYFPKIT